MALFMLELKLSESLQRKRQLATGGSSEFASVKAADLSFDLHTRILSPTHRRHTHTFNGPLSRTTRERRYQKRKASLDFTEARDSEWQWHQLGHMQVCTSRQTDNHASNPTSQFFTGRMPFLPPNQQCQSTEGKFSYTSLTT